MHALMYACMYRDMLRTHTSSACTRRHTDIQTHRPTNLAYTNTCSRLYQAPFEHRHRHKETDRQTDRQIDRQTDRRTDRQTLTHAHTHL
jgi:hypothetical protein